MYDVGEILEVIIPYKEGDIPIPVFARVVRLDPIEGSFHKGIAIQLDEKSG